ncbi:uncharacterized protein Dvar_81830 [Desulfosarcina variabilis str. Montpellier]
MYYNRIYYIRAHACQDKFFINQSIMGMIHKIGSKFAVFYIIIGKRGILNILVRIECIINKNVINPVREYDQAPDPTLVILNAVWQKLQQTHVLRLVKS